MNKLYFDMREIDRILYWIINGEKVYHLLMVGKNEITDLNNLAKEIKASVLKTDLLVLEYN